MDARRRTLPCRLRHKPAPLRSLRHRIRWRRNGQAPCRRIVSAMTAHPELVSGTGRSCAILMRSAKGRVAVKIVQKDFTQAWFRRWAFGSC
ncbi:MAG: asparaginase [Rhizomicrobium sp.]